MKKLLSILTVFAMLFALCAPAFAETAEPLTYLLLGDSIAYGAGILNHEDACYGRIVANTNGYNYKNDAVKGIKSGELLQKVSGGSVRGDIEEADIISISIGGNDFIKNPLYIPAVILSMFGSDGIVGNIVDGFYPNFCKIIEKIKEINPDALILVQTLYNPQKGALRSAFDKGVKPLNDCFYKYLEENPGAYEIVDVYTALSTERGIIAIDTIHPNAKGNVLIAKAVLAKLRDLGLSDTAEPVILVEGVNEIRFLYYWFLYPLA